MRARLLIVAAILTTGAAAAPSGTLVVLPNDPLLHKHGRWDAAPGTWWAGSGFKLVASGLTSLTLNLGNHTTSPQAAVALSVDYSEFTTVNVTAGTNIIPIPAASSSAMGKNRVVRMNVEGWQNNRMHLESIELNLGAVLKPYKPSPLRFQFIGDSLSAGQYNPRGVNDAWSFLTAQEFKAEHNINAQPGACLLDQLCWGNYHGVSYQYFRTEDTGANDNAYQIPGETFGNSLSTFIGDIRKLYAKQPIFVLTSWGWPNSDGVSPFSLYYDGVYTDVVNKRISGGDKNIFLVNATGWVGYDGVYPDNQHPTPLGHQQVLTHFTAWLKQWGLQPRSSWSS